ncbi:hypothetical protein CERZMDRAFT_90044 [Cercospora zeae-maydis SCOH1-5]|uniref:Uncharacterized protein n=1 Tax=Cercospora zeae-maydis SCOH1-5 TaxID=717836 RepID=A0A6A6FR74_9PEZI|nr:hypothetical protein CERZMDRAFT_90044 [Cercospora zeae-maydis SCOH1-5]
MCHCASSSSPSVEETSRSIIGDVVEFDNSSLCRPCISCPNHELRSTSGGGGGGG